METVKVTIIFEDHGASLFQYGNTLIPPCHNYSFWTAWPWKWMHYGALKRW